jgi:ribose-phosphate pyrophosphokinase
VTEFGDGESIVEIKKTVRLMDIFLLYPMRDPDVNTAYVRFFMTLDALSRASVGKVIIIAPYMPFSRQDRKPKPRQPISAKMVAKHIEVEEETVKGLITFDFHSEQIQGFYNIPVDNLYGHKPLLTYCRALYGKDFASTVICSPDGGGVTRARRFAHSSEPKLRYINLDKYRNGVNSIEMLEFHGNVEGCHIILFDDLIDTGTTTVEAVKVLRQAGALSVLAAATHGVFSRSKKDGRTAEDRLREAGVKVMVTESIPRSDAYKAANRDWLTIVPIDEILAETISTALTPGGSIDAMNHKC